MPTVVKGEGLEQTPQFAMARIDGATGVPITKAAITSIVYDLWMIPVPFDERTGNWKALYVDLASPEKVVGPISLVVDDSVFDDLVTPEVDPRWTVDSIGYNFLGLIIPSSLPTLAVASYPRAQWLRVDFKFNPVTGDDFIRSFLVAMQPKLFGK